MHFFFLSFDAAEMTLGHPFVPIYDTGWWSLSMIIWCSDFTHNFNSPTLISISWMCNVTLYMLTHS
jgi:hypothetical protein